MHYHVVTRWGDSEDEPNERRMLEVLNELDVEDPEHPDCWLTHETGWTLAMSESGRVVYENLECDSEPRHLTEIPRLKALEMWRILAEGDLVSLESEPWQPGYHAPLSDAEELARRDNAERMTREMDQKFYDSLGEERPEIPCKREGCQRGAVHFSVFCRPHHFETVNKKPSPFNH
jgi:hypothetical protein